MLFLLQKYAEKLLKYILVFQTIIDGLNEDYIVLDDLEDTGMVRYLNACEKDADKCILTCVMKNSERIYPLKGTSDQKKTLANGTSYYFSHVFGFKKLEYEPYYILIEKDKNIKYKVIKVPLHRPFFMKIMKLSQHHIPTFTTDEICTIITDILPYKDRAELLAHSICSHLQNNPDLVHELIGCVNNPESSHYSPQTRFLSSVVFNTNRTRDSFSDILSTRVGFKLVNQKDSDSVIYAYAGQKCPGKVFFFVSINRLTIKFLIKHLEMSYYSFKENQDALNSIFCKEPKELLESVKIYAINNEIDTVMPDLTSENQILSHKLSVITQSRFLLAGNIGSIGLQFAHFKKKIDFTCLNHLKMLNDIICWKCSLNFVKSIPEQINIEMYLSEDKTDNLFKETPSNIVNVSYSNCHISDCSKISGKIRSITIDCCPIDSNDVLSFGKNYENVTVKTRKPIKIEMNGYVGFEEVFLGGSKNSVFKFNKEPVTHRGVLELIDAKIMEMAMPITISENIHEATFECVQLLSDSTIVFPHTGQSIQISRSQGLFDLEAYIGFKQLFTYNMAVKVLPIQNSEISLSYILLRNIQLDQNIILPNNYEYVVLENVVVDENASVLLNKACKRLVISGCSGTFNISDAEYFENITICYSIYKDNDIRFVGSRVVNHLHLRNICGNMEVVKSQLKCFKQVKHLQFTFNYSDEAEDIGSDVNLSTIFENIFGKNVNPVPEYLPSHEDCYLKTACKKSEFAVNFILSEIFTENFIDSVTELELTSITITPNNYDLVNSLSNLAILKIRSASLTYNFFKCLPIDLRILDVSGSHIFYESAEHNTCNGRKNYSNNVKIASLSAKVLFQLPNIGLLLPSLMILKIQFDPMCKADYIVHDDVIQLEELFIECKEEIINLKSPTIEKQEFIAFVRLLSRRIDLRFLKYCTLVSEESSIVINPLTFEVLTAKTMCQPNDPDSIKICKEPK